MFKRMPISASGSTCCACLPFYLFPNWKHITLDRSPIILVCLLKHEYNPQIQNPSLLNFNVDLLIVFTSISTTSVQMWYLYKSSVDGNVQFQIQQNLTLRYSFLNSHPITTKRIHLKCENIINSYFPFNLLFDKQYIINYIPNAPQ
jgi:hypothetical protein